MNYTKPNPLGKLSASEALFGFCGWLTTLDRMEVGAHNSPHALFNRLLEFVNRNNLDNPREGWETLLAPASYDAFRAAQGAAEYGALRRQGEDGETFRLALQKLLNAYSVDAKVQVPDFILAHMLGNLLEATAQMIAWRDEWKSPNGVALKHLHDGPPAPGL